jgi:hypothetical protein
LNGLRIGESNVSEETSAYISSLVRIEIMAKESGYVDIESDLKRLRALLDAVRHDVGLTAIALSDPTAVSIEEVVTSHRAIVKALREFAP